MSHLPCTPPNNFFPPTGSRDGDRYPFQRYCRFPTLDFIFIIIITIMKTIGIPIMISLYISSTGGQRFYKAQLLSSSSALPLPSPSVFSFIACVSPTSLNPFSLFTCLGLVFTPCLGLLTYRPVDVKCIVLFARRQPLLLIQPIRECSLFNVHCFNQNT